MGHHSRTFLRAKLHPRCLTSVEVGESDFPGVLSLCPKLPGGTDHGLGPGSRIAVTTSALVPQRLFARHAATLVLVDARRNAPIEIRRQTARFIQREPSFSPPPPVVVVRETVPTL